MPIIYHVYVKRHRQPPRLFYHGPWSELPPRCIFIRWLYFSMIPFVTHKRIGIALNIIIDFSISHFAPLMYVTFHSRRAEFDDSWLPCAAWRRISLSLPRADFRPNMSPMFSIADILYFQDIAYRADYRLPDDDITPRISKHSRARLIFSPISM